MAKALYTGALGVSQNGSSTLPPLQTRRKYDRSDKLLLRALADAPALHIIIMRAQKRPVKDIKYYTSEDDYFIQSCTLKGCNQAGTDAALAVGTAYIYVQGAGGETARSFLQVGNVIHIPAMQENQTNTKGTGDGTTDGAVAMAGEDMIVFAIISENVVQVTRGGGAGSQSYNVTADSGSTLNADVKGPVLADASASPASINQAIEEDYNYREIKRVSWKVTGRNLMQDMYGPDDSQRLAIMNRTQLFRYIEREFWTNHRYLDYNADGKERSHTGGMFEFIADTSATGTRVATYDASKDLVMGDGSQRVWKVNENFDLDNFNVFMEKAQKYAGPQRQKVGFGGRGFLVKLESQLRPYYNGFDWDVDTFGFGVVMARNSFGEIPIVVEQEFSEGSAGYHYDFVVLDMENIWYTYGVGPCAIKGCGNPNSDIHVHQEIQNNDEAARKDELFVDYGWDQRFRISHSWLNWDGK